MKILTMVTSGVGDATKASVPIHLAVNGSAEIGDEPVVLIAGDAAEWLSGDAIETGAGVGVPPMRELVAKLRQHAVPVFV